MATNLGIDTSNIDPAQLPILAEFLGIGPGQTSQPSTAPLSFLSSTEQNTLKRTEIAAAQRRHADRVAGGMNQQESFRILTQDNNQIRQVFSAPIPRVQQQTVNITGGTQVRLPPFHDASATDIQNINIATARLQLENLLKQSAFTDLANELALPQFKRIAAEQQAFFDSIPPGTLAALQLRDVERAFSAGGRLEELTELQLDQIRNAGVASDRERELIGNIANQAIARGESDINRQRDEAFQSLRENFAPGLGLRPTDTPILDRGGRIAEESARQAAQLAREVRAAESSQLLEFPLARGESLARTALPQQELALQSANLAEQLLTQGFQNRLQLVGLGGQAGLNLAGIPSAAQNAGLLHTILNAPGGNQSGRHFSAQLGNAKAIQDILNP